MTCACSCHDAHADTDPAAWEVDYPMKLKDGRPAWVPEDAGYKTLCWRWNGFIIESGYGRARAPYGRTPAHRFTYTMVNGPIGEGLVLDHLCRNRACVNPAHLDPVDNPTNIRRGATAKLTAREARAIKRRLDAARGTRVRVPAGLIPQLAAEYGVRDRAIIRIGMGHTWNNV